jgi:hypothetical protein
VDLEHHVGVVSTETRSQSQNGIAKHFGDAALDEAVEGVFGIGSGMVEVPDPSGPEPVVAVLIRPVMTPARILWKN